MDDIIEKAAAIIHTSDALLITAGAGMGVDSGLPDFRGPEGFWRAYPPYRQLGLRFEELADPSWFSSDPHLAWGFYGHRLALYRATRPHEGFSILRRWASQKARGSFVFTSNVDCHFQRAGFDEERVLECHGSLSHQQCMDWCGAGIFAADSVEVAIDPMSFRAVGVLPSCPSCGALARPNVLMFGDGEWDGARTSAAERRLERWLGGAPDLAIIELGAGTAVPSVRSFGEWIAAQTGARLVRINLREPDVGSGHVGIPLGALEALCRIDARLR